MTGFMARVPEGTRRLPPLPRACNSRPIFAYGRVALRKRPNRPFLQGLAQSALRFVQMQVRGTGQKCICGGCFGPPWATKLMMSISAPLVVFSPYLCP